MAKSNKILIHCEATGESMEILHSGNRVWYTQPGEKPRTYSVFEREDIVVSKDFFVQLLKDYPKVPKSVLLIPQTTGSDLHITGIDLWDVSTIESFNSNLLFHLFGSFSFQGTLTSALKGEISVLPFTLSTFWENIPLLISLEGLSYAPLRGFVAGFTGGKIGWLSPDSGLNYSFLRPNSIGIYPDNFLLDLLAETTREWVSKEPN